MRTVFVDTSCYLALINGDDEHHSEAVRIQRTQRALLLTTEYVLVELLDGLASRGMRRQAAHAVASILSDPVVSVIPASSELFAAAFRLYRARGDKDWGLTDCMSFVVMQQYGVTDALTADRHFEQAGFRALLRS